VPVTYFLQGLDRNTIRSEKLKSLAKKG